MESENTPSVHKVPFPLRFTTSLLGAAVFATGLATRVPAQSVPREILVRGTFPGLTLGSLLLVAMCAAPACVTRETGRAVVAVVRSEECEFPNFHTQVTARRTSKAAYLKQGSNFRRFLDDSVQQNCRVPLFFSPLFGQ